MTSLNPNDEELIQLYMSTQKNLYFAQLYDRYVGKVYRRCFSLTKCAARAEDYTHDIFIRVHTNLGKFKERSTFSTWLYSISYNYCLDQIRLAGQINTVTIDDEHAIDVPEESDPDSRENQFNSLTLVMDTVPTDEATLLRLKYEQDIDIKELARWYNLSDSAVKMRLKRTRDKIREHHTY